MTSREQIEHVGAQEFVTVHEAALLLNISERTIWRRLRAGKLHFELSDGRIRRLRKAAVVRFFKNPDFACQY
jgi:excisionase family DNA binding protein